MVVRVDIELGKTMTLGEFFDPLENYGGQVVFYTVTGVDGMEGSNVGLTLEFAGPDYCRAFLDEVSGQMGDGVETAMSRAVELL